MSKYRKQKEEPLKGYGFRASERKIIEAGRLGIDIPQLIREAIDDAIAARTGTCRMCGQNVGKLRKSFCDEN